MLGAVSVAMVRLPYLRTYVHSVVGSWGSNSILDQSNAFCVSKAVMSRWPSEYHALTAKKSYRDHPHPFSR